MTTETLLREYMSSGLTHEFRWVQEWANASGSSTFSVEDKMRQVLQRRNQKEPLAYIFGEWPCCGLNLKVGPGVLIPRPETEELAELVVQKWVTSPGNFRIIDLGSGSGCLGLGVSNLILDRFPNSTIELTLVEKSPQARNYLEQNAQEFLKDFHTKVKIEIVFNDWSVLSGSQSKKFDILLANPPYVSAGEYLNLDESVKNFEPKEALVPQREDPFGVTCYEEIFSLCSAKHGNLEPSAIALEIGHNQGTELIRLGNRFLSHYGNRELLKDMCGKERFFLVSNSKEGI
jgi:release factor glutamine methyltransferase